jgi:hypothetical protein
LHRQSIFPGKAAARNAWGLFLGHVSLAAVSLVDLCKLPEATDQLLERISFVDSLIAPAGTGTMSVHGAEDYEKTVDQILESLVLLAKPKASDVVSRINTEIATGRYPPGSPAEWLAEGHVTCSIRCLNGDCKRMVDVGSTRCRKIARGRASALTCSAPNAARPAL